MAAPQRLFDIRRVIGGLFVVYGLILAVTGLLDSAQEIQKAEGIRINLWTGIAMLVVGGAFLLWERLRPSDGPTSSNASASSGEKE
ncbi:hypothetical protein [Microbispora hainanensis]|uniref:Uncharacterized protein n=1 Tax=Microbispora hainanensis TaxID=568844 RepID=A0A544XV74_9ACTN|nr:hypothetical protein [Microbispora hainanensis]TQS08390.1 hypothetical protein FLX08_39015 [Microbispora hainanensis]